MKGTLFVVALPIGNLKDITLRALEVLREVDIILAEDTRSFKKLLRVFQLPPKRVLSFYREVEKKREDNIIELLKEGKKIALCSEAGTPLISDPGSKLIQRVHREKIKVVPIPGVSALTCALSVAGIDLSPGFIFLGFIPEKEKELRQRFSSLPEDLPIVLFIPPHDFPTVIRLLLKILGNREAFLARELTKFHEELVFSTLEELSKREDLKGEITLVIGPAIKSPSAKNTQSPPIPLEELKSRFLELKSKGFKKREISKLLAKDLGLTTKEVYQILKEL
ncbi:MAG: 16S rRNA (cytidine(1402)-2'-O)-methyltransferase [Caldimicrobium sp.]|nr:16S rRNA (cytidine(1402)-2'-O)-methyltransferase [Caldimicrobium sp.]MCX7874180.1 16S rRNA (cytidine(1402)-2'-O)-methyltransferase [Caldimicrobium sp.]MDW8094323.1 16S rRNA (cytidine(1402)-2'-O)-methyltransferase [Caldimicrobium sp.]